MRNVFRSPKFKKKGKVKKVSNKSERQPKDLLVDDILNAGCLDDDDILCEILTKLPVKSLLRFKCVCKYWQSLIQSPYFVESHLTRSKTRPSLCICSPCGFPKTNLFLVDLIEGGAAVHWLKTTFLFEHTSIYVNGLTFLIECGGFAVRIYNPSTREITPSIATPFQPRKGEPDAVLTQQAWYGFGFDHATKEHKLVCIWEICRLVRGTLIFMRFDIFCEVLTVGDNTWRRIDEVPQYQLEGTAVTVNGTMYWVNKCSTSNTPSHDVIVAFDVGREKFRVIPIPNFILQPPHVLSYRFVVLLEVDGCIALLHKISDYTVKLAILNDNGHNEEDDDGNEKNTTISTSNSNWIEETIELPFYWRDGIRDFIEVRAIAGTDEMIIASRESYDTSPVPQKGNISLYYYDRKKKTFKLVEITGIHSLTSVYNIDIFTESLLPVQKQKP